MCVWGGGARGALVMGSQTSPRNAGCVAAADAWFVCGLRKTWRWSDSLWKAVAEVCASIEKRDCSVSCTWG